MTRHNLPQPFASPLFQEGKHRRITVGIAKPGGEVGLRDALFRRLCPPEVIERSREVDAAKLRQGIQHHRHKDQHPRNHHEHLVFHLDEQRQQQSAYGIEQQDIAAPDKHQMAEADAGQYQHAAHEERYTPSGKYQRESYAKQHREDGVELAVDKGKLQESHHLVYFSSGHHRLFIRREEGPQCKLREIGQRDVCQCQSPKNIEYQVTLLFCRRSKFLCHHGCKDKHFFCKPSTKKQQKITFSAYL